MPQNLLDKYNTTVRNAMSNEFVNCSSRINAVRKELVDKQTELSKGKNRLTYMQYTRLEEQINRLQKEYEHLEIERNIWDRAREICLEIADDML